MSAIKNNVDAAVAREAQAVMGSPIVGSDDAVASLAATSAKADGPDPRYTNAELQAMGLQAERLPRHVAIIMDGNGRWARSQGRPRFEGHAQGARGVRPIVEECSRLGIEQLTLYCLSSENWKRPASELELLMQLFEQYLIEERAELQRQQIRLAIIGRREGLSAGVLREMQISLEATAQNPGLCLCLAVNYGSRGEIVDAVREIAAAVAAGSLSPADIDESTISEALYTRGMPDPDLVIRTAGELRVSNYLLWQISYAELWVTQTHWPAFTADTLREALRDFAQRTRRFGGLVESRTPAEGSGAP